ncbi:MAG: lipopolysaccharide heptosyltransferase II [Phycisphaerales bacterium]
MASTFTRPLRLLVVCPSWVGDAVMATPALRLLRSSLPGAFIGGLVRPGIDELLAGAGFFDEVHVERAEGVMGPKHAAAKVRPRRYDTALLLANSFSSALIARLAGVPRRVGYARDARSLLLTDRLEAPRRADGRWLPIPALAYYWHAARWLLDPALPRAPGPALPADARMELAETPEQAGAATTLLSTLAIPDDAPVAILNPGGNNPAKRWPADRYAALAGHLASRHGMTVLVSGSPAEHELTESIAAGAAGRRSADGRGGTRSVAGRVTLASLKGLIRRARLMVTNDTGPRHIGAAFGVPVVTLFGPTDHRWTTIPAPAGETVLLADPALPEAEVADDHPERCRVDRITLERVVSAAEGLLARAGPPHAATRGSAAS